MNTRYNPDVHRRRSIRLRDFDYRTDGAYFVTICTQHRVPLFGMVQDDKMQLNGAGLMLVSQWQTLPQRFQGIRLDAFVVMPNHIHGIVVLTDGGARPSARATTRDGGARPSARATTRDGGTRPSARATTRVAPTSLGAVIGAYKSLTTVEFIRGVKTFRWPPFDGKLWQRNYYEHIIRNDNTLHDIRQYIIHNPAKWAEDAENPARSSRP